jgi:2-hydroxychromene-2-carboxylate isomerase
MMSLARMMSLACLPVDSPQPSQSIEVYADVGCPFAHAALRMLVAERTARDRHDLAIVVRAWPLELVNGEAIDPIMIAEEVDDIRAQVAPDAFVGFRTDAFPATTQPAMELTARAYEAGTGTGEDVALACRDLLFEQGVDVGDPGVLAAVASEHGVDLPAPGDRDLVRADYERGRARGVVGSPHFFVDETNWFCPSLDIRRAGTRLRISFDQSGFDRLVTSCFDGDGSAASL